MIKDGFNGVMGFCYLTGMNEGLLQIDEIPVFWKKHILQQLIKTHQDNPILNSEVVIEILKIKFKHLL
jgi:hypothetical protein